MEGTDLNMLKIIMESGVIVKLVLLSLVLASVVSWAIIIKKQKAVRKVADLNKKFLEIYNNSGNLKEVKEQCESMPTSPFRNMFLSGYDELTKIMSRFEGPKAKHSMKEHFQVFGLGVIERGLRKGVNESNAMLDQFLSVLASIGSITPFVGLFGTVWGIIDSFTGLASGGATLDAVAPGIAEALVATAVGLAAAIPAVWFYNYFSNENSRMNSEMESFGQEFLNLVERTLITKPGKEA